MTNKEWRLLKILVVTFLVAVSGGVIYTEIDRIVSAERAIESYSKARAKLPKVPSDTTTIDARIKQIKESIEKLPANEKEGLFSDFATDVRAMLSRYRLEPTQYQVLGSGNDEALELSLRCETVAFLRFLKTAANERRGWDIPYLAVRPIVDGTESSITIRVKHAR